MTIVSKATLKVTVLGCGSSGGVPRVGNDWGACDPAEPRNRRRRCSILVERGETAVLIDTSPDLREQLLDAGTRRLDAVFYTHDHADQSHGIDDLRALALTMRRRIDVYSDEATARTLMSRFGYCFEEIRGSGYPPILRLNEIGMEPLTVDGPGGAITLTPFEVEHGRIRALGFRIGPVAYTPDVSDVPEAAFDVLEGVDTWIVDALRYTPHPTHAHLEKTLQWVARVNPARAVLTNLHVDLDYHTLCRDLPAGVTPAFDGMVLAFDMPVS